MGADGAAWEGFSETVSRLAEQSKEASRALA
jgi:hypothetical protein